ncbi:Uncharacterised protein [Mycobacteroides abscessus subsp. abscessus]|nr:Uncharacterised protein [Mycobacteroides abscessus subsp. abscessus]
MRACRAYSCARAERFWRGRTSGVPDRSPRSRPRTQPSIAVPNAARSHESQPAIFDEHNEFNQIFVRISFEICIDTICDAVYTKGNDPH